MNRTVVQRMSRGWLAFCLLLLSGNLTTFYAQTTSFTYQGRVTDGGTAANGNYDLQFKLFDNASNGAQIGATQTLNAVSVSSGIFTVILDFGAGAFPGANRYLEISARLSGTATFTLLTPRQQVTSTPYAIRSLSAATADSIPANGVPPGSGNYVQNTATPQANTNFNISGNGTVGGSLNMNGAFPNGLFLSNGTAALRGTIVNNSVLLGTTTNSPLILSSNNGTNNGSVTLDTTGNVGIDASAPETKLTVHTFGSDYGLTHTNGSVKLVTFIGGNFNGGYLGTRSNHPLHLFTNDSGPLMTVTTSGNVGVGTTAPNAKLFVQGEATNGVGIAATGNAAQSADKGGWIKAMIYVRADGTIARCFNGVTGSSAGNCGFSLIPLPGFPPGFYQVDFGLNVSSRFFSLTVLKEDGNERGGHLYSFPTSTAVIVHTFRTGTVGENTDFFLIVY